jgi:hypothetical protein
MEFTYTDRLGRVVRAVSTRFRRDEDACPRCRRMLDCRQLITVDDDGEELSVSHHPVERC